MAAQRYLKIIITFCLIGVSFSALASTSSPTFETFKKSFLEQLVNLSKEVGQLETKGKNIPQEQKAAFDQEMSQFKATLQNLNDAAASLKNRISEKKKSELSARVSNLEHDLDSAENTYGDKHLGLGDLLGF